MTIVALQSARFAMKVGSVLRRKGKSVTIVPPELPVLHVAQWLRAKNIGAAIVSADGRHLSGMISERDIVHALARHGEDTLRMTASELMTRAVVTCTPDDSLTYLMRIMTDRHLRHIPVIENGELGGIVSIGDVVKHRLAEVELESNVLRDSYITHH